MIKEKKFISFAKPCFMCFSCSGRIIIFVGSENVKKGCQWVVVQHKEIEDKDDTWSKIIEASENKSGIMTLKFEPFVSYMYFDAELFDDGIFLKMTILLYVLDYACPMP